MEIIEKILNGEGYKKEFPTQERERFLEQLKEPLKDDNEIKRVEICIMKYKKPKYEKQCVNKIIDNTYHPYKLNFFDNRLNSANTSKVWNKFIRESTCEYIVIMDTDAFVEPYWLEALVEAFKYPDCALSVPVVGNSVATIVQQQSHKNIDPIVTDGHVSGMCFLTKKSIIEELGYFDERFLVFGQDSDMNERINRHDKYKIYVCPRSLVYHGKKIGDNWKCSFSTNSAAKDNEFNWGIDTRVAQDLLKHKYNNYYNE